MWFLETVSLGADSHPVAETVRFSSGSGPNPAKTSRFPLRSPRRFTFFVVALLSAVFARAEIKVGDSFPALVSTELAPLAGGAIPATKDKVVLVDFWASWCGPCKASFPMMAKLQRDYAARGLVIVAVGVDEKPADAVTFVKKLAPNFPTVHDRAQKLVARVVAPSMPTSYLVGRDGRVRFRHEGYHGDVTERELRKEIEALLAEKI